MAHLGEMYHFECFVWGGEEYEGVSEGVKEYEGVKECEECEEVKMYEEVKDEQRQNKKNEEVEET